MPSPSRYAFGPFRLDPVERSLMRDGRPVRLTPKDLGVLLALVERHGALVDRERLFAQVWPGVIVEDCNLARHVATIRQALGDVADAPVYIETLPKRGYRFVAPVRELAAEPASATPADEPRALQAAEAPSLPGAEPSSLDARSTEAPSPGPSPRPRVPVARRWPRLSRAFPHAAAALVGLAVVALVGRYSAAGQAQASGPIRSLAVLPVANLTGDPRQEYLAEALGEMMINDLGRQRELQVVPRGSARRYQGSSSSARAIGRELGVHGLLEAAVVRAGDRVRVTAELVDARSDRLVWAEVFEGDACDFMELQDLIAQAVVEALGIPLEQSQQLPVARTARPVVKGLTCSTGAGATAVP